MELIRYASLEAKTPAQRRREAEEAKAREVSELGAQILEGLRREMGR